MSAENKGSSMKAFYILFIAVAVIGLGALGYNLGSSAFGAAAMEPVDLEGVRDDMVALRDLAVPLIKGEEDAPVTIIVFGDYYCNHCAAFSLRHRPLVEEKYVDTGQARLVFYDFVLDPRPAAGTFLAARAARCAADQGRFWEYHDRLYRSQLTWGQEADKLGTFEGYGDDVGLNGDDFKACLNSDRHAEEVTANRELAQALGLGGTPMVMVGTGAGMSRRLPDYYFETIEQAVDEILAGGEAG